MDAVMDITARAVSFITTIQNIYLSGRVLNDTDYDIPFEQVDEGSRNDSLLETYIAIIKKDEKDRIEKKLARRPGFANIDRQMQTGFKSKVIELVWLSARILHEDDDDDDSEIRETEKYFVSICVAVSDWVNHNFNYLQKIRKDLEAFSPPYVWRKAISDYIYKNQQQRVDLAEAMEYIPIHVVLALGGCQYDATKQRILQWWPDERKESGYSSNIIILEDDEQQLRKDFRETATNQKSNGLPGGYSDNIKYLLKNQRKLTLQLLEWGAPLPFEYILNCEIDCIEKARKRRSAELMILKERIPPKAIKRPTANLKEIEKQEDTEDPFYTKDCCCDPLQRAEDNKLFALAFSGGGIRSATFNLGILQGLAKKGFISKVDYLSTVSGGGYIGSWLVTWIKRDGSVKNVSDRLDPNKSADPLGEEVRPIRWLRMFSNYLSPNKSIMSVDAWTVGVTWLRNTLLNQVMLFFILMSGLMLLRSVYELWAYEHLWNGLLKSEYVYITACALLFLLSLIIGSSMQWYDNSKSARLRFEQKGSSWLTGTVLLIAGAGSYMVSASMYLQTAKSSTFSYKLYTLWPAAAVTLVILLWVASRGNYYKCIEGLAAPNTKYKRARSVSIILYTSVLATAIGWASLAGVWQIFNIIKYSSFASLKMNELDSEILKKFIGFCFGPPGLLLVFSLTVVARMALLGKYFPDERREWWGRMGAVINRMSFLWILISLLVSYLLIRNVLTRILHDWESAPATIAGWMVLVGGTVKAAFNANTGKESNKKGFQGIALNILSLAGPYIFILGLLIFLPRVAEPLLQRRFHWKFLDDHANLKAFLSVIYDRVYLKALLLAIGCFGIGFFLSGRIGVNEFSMHHFYRNRLVRAYLGATRRKANRERTANPFTAFDKLDDEKLANFVKENGYYGPYPILNTALNASQVSDLSRQDRKAESFIFSPLFCGFDFSKVRASINSRIKSYDFGYRPTAQYAYPNDNGPAIGTAMAISGAAVNPNQGYHSSPGVAFLLTVFNVSMGWWIGNPRKGKWQQSDPKNGLINIVENLTANTSTRKNFVCLSDGGHFDNMGLYEMIRRRCSLIILGDGEQDEEFTCEGFANAIRRCRIDFGAEIDIKTEKITKREGRFSQKQYAVGTITYAGEDSASGVLIYIKSSIKGDEPVDVVEYTKKNETFPHQTTGDQFFDEEQFESYRKLGMFIADRALEDMEVTEALKKIYK